MEEADNDPLKTAYTFRKVTVIAKYHNLTHIKSCQVYPSSSDVPSTKSAVASKNSTSNTDVIKSITNIYVAN